MRFFKYLLVIFFLFIVAGCKGDDIRDFRHNGYALSDKKFKCGVSVKYLYDNFLVSESGVIYDLSYELPYKNGLNCKLVSSDFNVSSIYSNEIFKSEDGNLYLFNHENKNSFPLLSDNKIAEYFLDDSSVLKVIFFDDHYYVLEADGNVYDYILNNNGDSNFIDVVSKKMIFDKSNFDTDIIDFNISDNISNNYIKTYTKYYTNQLKNKDCLKYADVKCEYELKEDKLLVKYRDKIYAFDGQKIILNSGKVLEKNS